VDGKEGFQSLVKIFVQPLEDWSRVGSGFRLDVCVAIYEEGEDVWRGRVGTVVGVGGLERGFVPNGWNVEMSDGWRRSCVRLGFRVGRFSVLGVVCTSESAEDRKEVDGTDIECETAERR
jgi:hypothetical protein